MHLHRPCSEVPLERADETRYRSSNGRNVRIIPVQNGLPIQVRLWLSIGPWSCFCGATFPNPTMPAHALSRFLTYIDDNPHFKICSRARPRIGPGGQLLWEYMYRA
jgi:hypothetical protein